MNFADIWNTSRKDYYILFDKRVFQSLFFFFFFFFWVIWRQKFDNFILGHKVLCLLKLEKKTNIHDFRNMRFTWRVIYSKQCIDRCRMLTSGMSSKRKKVEKSKSWNCHASCVLVNIHYRHVEQIYLPQEITWLLLKLIHSSGRNAMVYQCSIPLQMVCWFVFDGIGSDTDAIIK